MIFVAYFYMENHSRLYVTPSLFTCSRLPNSSKEVGYIYHPNEILAKYNDKNFRYFFYATTNEPTYVVLVIVELPFQHHMRNNLRGGPSGNYRRHVCH